jgi:hypothetical protein
MPCNVPDEGALLGKVGHSAGGILHQVAPAPGGRAVAGTSSTKGPAPVGPRLGGQGVELPRVSALLEKLRSSRAARGWPQAQLAHHAGSPGPESPGESPSLPGSPHVESPSGAFHQVIIQDRRPVEIAVPERRLYGKPTPGVPFASPPRPPEPPADVGFHDGPLHEPPEMVNLPVGKWRYSRSPIPRRRRAPCGSMDSWLAHEDSRFDIRSLAATGVRSSSTSWSASTIVGPCPGQIPPSRIGETPGTGKRPHGLSQPSVGQGFPVSGKVVQSCSQVLEAHRNPQRTLTMTTAPAAMATAA